VPVATRAGSARIEGESKAAVRGTVVRLTPAAGGDPVAPAVAPLAQEGAAPEHALAITLRLGVAFSRGGADRAHARAIVAPSTIARPCGSRPPVYFVRGTVPFDREMREG